jgi:hypothetical protein
VAIVFNLIVLGINSGGSNMAVNHRSGSLFGNNHLVANGVLGIFILMTVLVNGIAVAGWGWGARRGPSCWQACWLWSRITR